MSALLRGHLPTVATRPVFRPTPVRPSLGKKSHHAGGRRGAFRVSQRQCSGVVLAGPCLSSSSSSSSSSLLWREGACASRLLFSNGTSRLFSKSASRLLSDCASGLLFNCASRQFSNCASEQFFNCTSGQLSNCTSRQLSNCTSRQFSKCTSEQFKCTSRQFSDCTSRQFSNCTFGQFSNCTSEQFSNCTSRLLSDCTSRQFSKCTSEQFSNCTSRQLSNCTSTLFSRDPLGLSHNSCPSKFGPMAACEGRAGLRRYSSSSSMAAGFHVSEEVRDALHCGKAVVALESTIITHGMPWPANEKTALKVEETVRHRDAIPATIAVLNGTVCVGLSNKEIEQLADKSTAKVKVSRRDLPFVMAQGLTGGTTVSGTMVAAHRAGIPIFATGGIGGVHRGVEDSLDISADLRELGRTPVAVVAAGVKSILDIARTLEYLETEGVCVVTYGATTDFPAFFTPVSGHQSPYCVQSPQAAADVIDASLRAQLGSGMLFAVPIPEEFAASGETIDAAIRAAVEEARRSGVKGQEVTPFILERVNQLTEGASLEANVALIQNNAAVAADIAVALTQRKTQGGNSSSGLTRRGGSPPFAVRSASLAGAEGNRRSSAGKDDVSSTVCEGIGSQGNGRPPVVVGGAVVDFCAKLHNPSIKMNGATYGGNIRQSFGGVGRNIADCMSHLGNPPLFVSALGHDTHASALMTHCPHMNLEAVRVMEEGSTPTYCPVLTSQGHLLFGIGDMELHAQVTPDLVSLHQEEIIQAPIVCVDGNFSAAVIERVGQLCAEAGVPVWFEPTDINKADRPAQGKSWQYFTYISPNVSECGRIWSSVTGKAAAEPVMTSAMEVNLPVIVRYCRDLVRHFPVVMVTMGREGLILAQREIQEDGESPAVLHHYPSTPVGREPDSVVSVSGAGDCLNAAMMHFITQGHDLDLCVKAGLLAAQHSLQSHEAVPKTITSADFTAEKVEAWASFKPTLLRELV